jgi:hypothetical protein
LPLAVWYKFAEVPEVLAAPNIREIAARTSETLVKFYQTAQRKNPENSLHTHSSEDLKSR